jgi:hypothetical protein
LKIRPTAKVSLAAGMHFSAFETSSIFRPSQNHSFLEHSRRAEAW